MGSIGRFDSEGELLDWAHAELGESKERLSDWRQAAHENYAFYANDQWSEEDKLILEEQQRAATVFNRSSRTINAISGTEIQNRQEIRYYPREIGDAGVNEMMTNAARWVRDASNAEDEESEAFQDLLICGIGVIDISIDADSAEPMILIQRGDPLEYLWDAKARKKNLSDARWSAKLKKMLRRDILDTWPDAELNVTGAEQNYLDYPTAPQNVTPPRYDANKADDTSPDHDGYEVIEFSWFDLEPYYQVLTEQGQLAEFDAAKWKKVSKYVQERGLQYAKRRRKVFTTAYIVGREVLEVRPAISQDGLPNLFMTGFRDRNSNSWFGLMSVMRDPQRMANKLLSQFLHIVNANAKGGLLAETDAFEDVRKAEDDWARSDSILYLQPGGLNKIRERSYGQIPPGVERLLGYAVEAIVEVSGVNAELMGAVTRNQPGVLEETRKRAGITMVSIFFDSLRLYHKALGKMLMECIRKYIADGRLIRVLGKQGAEYIPLMKDALTAEYDVVVDEAPTSVSVKDKAFTALMQIVPMAMQMGIPIPPDVIDYAPIPESLIASWRKLMQPQEPNPEQEEQKAITKAAAIAEIEEKKSKAQLNIATAMEKANSAQAADGSSKAAMFQRGYEAETERLAREHEAKLQSEMEEQKHRQAVELAVLQARLKADPTLALSEDSRGALGALMEQNAKVAEAILAIPDAIRASSDNTREIMGGMSGLSDAIQSMIGGVSELSRLMRAPRHRQLHRDDSGRATHAIELIIDEPGTIQ